MTEMSAGIYGGGGFATTPIYSGGNTCTVVFSVESTYNSDISRIVVKIISTQDNSYIHSLVQYFISAYISIVYRLHCKKTFSPQSAQRTRRFFADFALLKLCALCVLSGEGFLQ